MRKLVKLAAAAMTLPVIAACQPSVQELAARTCIAQRDPDLGNAHVEIFGGGDSVVLTTADGYVGPLAGRREKIKTRAIDDRNTNPQVSELIETPPAKNQPGSDPDLVWSNKKPIAKVAGAEMENRIFTVCIEEARTLSQRPVQVASLAPR